jgi:hypothetical protein
MDKLRGTSKAIDAHVDDLDSFKKLTAKHCKNRMHLTKVFGLGDSDM